MLTPEDAQTLSQMGDTFATNAGYGYPRGLLYGIFLVIFCIGTTSLFARGVKNTSTKFLVGVTFIQFIAATYNFAGSAAILQLEIKGYLKSDDLSLTDRISSTRGVVAPVNIAFAWMQPTILFCSDLILCWRAWVLYPMNIIARLLLILCLLADAVLNVYITTVASFHIVSRLENVQLDIGLSESALLMSFVTNAVATFLIGFRAWKHRQMVINHINSGSLKVLVVVVETGAAFCVMQLIYAILNITDKINYTPLDFTQRTFTLLTTYTAAIYPTLVIVIVHLRYSLFDGDATSSTSSNSREGDRNVLSTLRFAGTQRTWTSSQAGVQSSDADDSERTPVNLYEKV